MEATFHDNSCSDSDQATVLELQDPKHVVYERRDSISLADAIDWASDAACPVTLFVYDQGANSMRFRIDADGQAIPLVP